MCYAIYIAILGMLIVYKDYQFDTTGLSVKMSDGSWVTTVVGWEMMSQIWPVLLMSAVAGSAVTYIFTQKILKR